MHGDHGEDVDEGGAVLAEVEDLELDLVVGLDGAAHGAHGVLVDVLAGRLAADLASRGLQEAAVLAHDLLVGVARQQAEGLGGVDDGRVGLLEVAEQQGDGAVDGAELDLGVRAAGDAELGVLDEEVGDGDGQDAPECSSCRSRWGSRGPGT